MFFLIQVQAVRRGQRAADMRRLRRPEPVPDAHRLGAVRVRRYRAAAGVGGPRGRRRRRLRRRGRQGCSGGGQAEGWAEGFARDRRGERRGGGGGAASAARGRGRDAVLRAGMRRAAERQERRRGWGGEKSGFPHGWSDSCARRFHPRGGFGGG